MWVLTPEYHYLSSYSVYSFRRSTSNFALRVKWKKKKGSHFKISSSYMLFRLLFIKVNMVQSLNEDLLKRPICGGQNDSMVGGLLALHGTYPVLIPGISWVLQDWSLIKEITERGVSPEHCWYDPKEKINTNTNLLNFSNFSTLWKNTLLSITELIEYKFFGNLYFKDIGRT